MKRPSFSEPPDLWELDGSVRDIYILEASEADWLSLFAVAERYPHSYTFGGEAGQLPTPGEIFSNRSGSHLLTIIVGSAAVNCHFFIPTEIELDVDPREVLLPTTHEQILEFLESLARETRKGLTVTAENSPELPFLSYEFPAAKWVVHMPKYTNDA
ncbi:MAG: hypothetical protein RLZZ373_1222 [Pseudomonadota bacterium]|jgi:hypothetical protein